MNTAVPGGTSRAEALVPPEEKFWKHYSPRGEAPLSLAGSVTLHGLAVGVFLLFTIFLASVFLAPSRPPLVEPVRLVDGGGPNGAGDGQVPGNGGQDRDEGPDKIDEPGAGPEARPKLTPIVEDRMKQKFEPDSVGYIVGRYTEPVRRYVELEDRLREKLHKGLRKGPDGGSRVKDGRKGPTVGPGPGPGPVGKLRLTPREKRMLRWFMRFRANNGAEYLRQLRELGTILAVPVGEGKERQYKIVRDLRRGAPLLDEDVSRLGRIYWVDDRRSSVQDLMAALGHPELRPNFFVALMPEKLEKDLFDMEKNYAINVLGVRPFDEDRIDETVFEVVVTPRGCRPELVRVTLKR